MALMKLEAIDTIAALEKAEAKEDSDDVRSVLKVAINILSKQ